MTTHTHRPGMLYYTDPKYTGDDIMPMHIYAAWSDVTEEDRGVIVYDPKHPGMRPIAPGTKFSLPGIVRELAKAGSALCAARQAEGEAMEAAKAVALKALARGITEVDVARSLGVDRMTVRKWAGKR